MAKKQSKVDNYRTNARKAATGGPDYRATSYGKGDVPRGGAASNSKFRLGLELIETAEEFGNESPEYMAKLEEWRNAQS